MGTAQDLHSLFHDIKKEKQEFLIASVQHYGWLTKYMINPFTEKAFKISAINLIQWILASQQ